MRAVGHAKAACALSIVYVSAGRMVAYTSCRADLLAVAFPRAEVVGALAFYRFDGR